MKANVERLDACPRTISRAIHDAPRRRDTDAVRARGTSWFSDIM